MRTGKTSAVVESGILAAITIVFAILGAYVPIISLFANFLCPLPITLCGQRHGLKWSIMCLAVAAIVITIVVNPLQALSMAAVFGLIGLVMGECMRRRLAPIKLLFFGSIGAFVATVISFAIGYLIMDINLLQVMLDSFNTAFSTMENFYRERGFTEQQLAAMAAENDMMKKMIVMILPVSFILVAPVTVLINFYLAHKIVNKLGDSYPWFSPFSELTVPRIVLLGYGLSIALLFFARGDREGLLFKVGFNIYTLCGLLLLMQAFAVLRWYVLHYNKPKWWFQVALIIAFLNQTVSQIVILGGAYDLLFDFRKIHKPLLTHKQAEAEGKDK